MNLDYAQTMTLADAVIQGTDDLWKTQIFFAPSFPFMMDIGLKTKQRTNIFSSAQNCSGKKNGAFTGEVSASMLKSIGTDAVIVGHSERRLYFNETNQQIAEKINCALENELLPIICYGESKEQRDAGAQFEIIETQIKNSLFHLSDSQMSKVIIAYEPVWAIGTGVNATPLEVEEIHLFIRTLIKDKFGKEVSEKTRILYGGSMNSKNSADIFSCGNVDGGLVGGASLKADEFISIIKTLEGL